jgi:hypothetical protein
MKPRNNFQTNLAISIALLSLAFSSPSHAQNSEFEYPELLVTPSASKRLETEAEAENSTRFTAHIPIQAASAFVVVAGMLAINDGRLKSQSSEDTPMAKWAGIGAISSGLGWLAITTTLSATYSPYSKGWAEVKKMPVGTKRQQLGREREAEERLAAPAHLASKLKWFSMFFNLSMSTFVITSSEDNVTRVAGLIASVASLTPLFFPSRWAETYDHHEDYRKRIYGPLGEVGLLRDPWAQKTVPAVSLSWRL